MRPKYKVTGCARFFLFLILFIPAVFFGAAYFRGENGVQIIKDFYHNIVGKSEVKSPAGNSPSDTYDMTNLKEELRQAKDEIKELKVKLYEKDQEISRLKSGEK